RAQGPRARADARSVERRERAVTRLSRVQRMALSFGAAVLLLLALFALGGVNPADVLGTLTRLSPGVYCLALLLHFTTTCLRAVRFQLLIPRSARPGF